MSTVTISFDPKMVVVTAAAAAAALLLYRARSLKGTTIWWIRKHKRYVHAATKPQDLIVITDFDATITSGDSEQCHDLIGFSKLMSGSFREAFAPLLDWCARKPTQKEPAKLLDGGRARVREAAHGEGRAASSRGRARARAQDDQRGDRRRRVVGPRPRPHGQARHAATAAHPALGA